MNVEGDWFDQRIVRGGGISVTGILVDDLGNRLYGNISSKIGNEYLNNATFTNDTTFITTGTVPEIYRNNHTLQLDYLGSEFIIGTSYKSRENILVPTMIRFEFEPSTVFAGDNVNVSLWLEEDDRSALPNSEVTVTLKKYFDEAKGDKEEVREFWIKRDPITRFEDALVEEGLFTKNDFETLSEEIDNEIKSTIEWAKEQDDPNPDEEIEDMFATRTSQVFTNDESSTETMNFIEAINNGLDEAMEEDKDIFMMGEDIGGFEGAFKATKGLSLIHI